MDVDARASGAAITQDSVPIDEVSGSIEGVSGSADDASGDDRLGG